MADRLNNLYPYKFRMLVAAQAMGFKEDYTVSVRHPADYRCRDTSPQP